MKKLSILLALILGGCASAPRPQLGIISHPKVPTPIVQPASPPAIATPLAKPKWYDRFRQKNGKWFH